MAQIYIHSEGLRQHIIRLEEEIQHIQKFIGLVESCKEYDTMHQRELREMQEILEHMEIKRAAEPGVVPIQPPSVCRKTSVE